MLSLILAVSAYRLEVLASTYGSDVCEWQWSPAVELFVSTHADPATGEGDPTCPAFPVQEVL